MILEGLVTTLDADGASRVAAMGAEFVEDGAGLVLRPYQTSRTFRNLQRTREGVFHVIDNVEMIAQAVVGYFPEPPRQRPAPVIRGVVLEDACRWYALAVETIDASQPRATIACRVVAAGSQREFWGFNRAKHAVVEAAILATRLTLPPGRDIQEELRSLGALVDKTGGAAERRAFAILVEYIHRQAGESGRD